MQRFLTLQVQGSEAGRATLAALRARLFERGEPSLKAIADTLAMLAGIDLRAQVSAIQTPTLVISGERDALAPNGAGAWLAATIPGAVHAPIAGAAHVPFLSHPAMFDAMLVPFLKLAT